MHKIISAASFFWFAALVLTFGFTTVSAQQKTTRARQKNIKPAKKTIKKSDDGIIYEPDAELLATLKEKVSVVESKKDWAELNRQSPISNASGAFSAYTAKFKMKNEPDAFETIIVIYEKAADKFYEIRGIDDFPWRPFDRIKWTAADVLEFEQWVNPNNGGRYAVNVKTGKIVRAGYVRSNQ